MYPPTMPISYDIETDYLYNQGIDKGKDMGIQRGIRIMLRTTQINESQIAEEFEVSLEQVLKLSKEERG